MAEELIYSIRLDGADENVKKLVESKQALATLGAEQKKLKEQQKLYDTQLKNGEITQEQYNEAVRVNLTQQVQLEVNTKKTKEAIRLQEMAVTSNANATGEATGSIKQLSAELSRLKSQYQNLSKAEREGAKGKEMLQKIQELDAEYKELHVSIGNTQVMVGSYQEAVNSLLPVMGGLGGQIQGVIGTLGQIKAGLSGVAGAMKAQAVATTGSSNALKLFKVALISTGIGAIVVALGSLIAAFASTQRGSDAISRALRPLKEIFATLVGFLQTKALAIFDRLKEAINNPRQAFSDLVDFIKQNVINRFKGIGKFFEGWAETFVNTFKAFGLKLKRVLNDVPLIGAGLDEKALKKLDKDIEDTVKKVEAGAMKIANGLGQFTTGIEDPVTKGIDLAKKAGKAMEESAKRAEQMEKLRVAIRKSEMTYKKDMAQNNLLAEKMKFILEDETKTMAERNKAGKEYLRLIEASGKREIDLLNMKVKLMKLEEEANDTSDEQKQERFDLEAESMEKLAGLTGRQIEVRNKLNSMEKEQANKLAEAQKKLAEDKLKAEEEAKKLAEERAKTELEQAKIVAEKKMRDLEFEQKMAKLLFAGTKQEEFELEKKHQKEMLDLKLDYARLSNEDETELKRENQFAMLEMEMNYNNQLAESRKKAMEVEAQTLKAQNDARNQAIKDNAEKLAGTLFDNEQNRIERTTKREIEALTLRRQAGEISAEEFEKKREEIDRKAFEKKKKLDTKEVVMNGIVAIAKIFAQSGFLLGLPQAIAMGAQTATQVAQINAQKFRFGGNVGGKSHSQGGTIIEAERGEAVIMKEAVNPFTAPILSAINTAYGGAPIEALNRFGSSNVPKMEMQQQRIEVINVATDTNTMANRVKNLQNSRRF